MKKNRYTGWFPRQVFYLIRWIIRLVYPKTQVVGTENLPEGGCIVVGNHTQMNGPICGELYFPGKRKIWCAGQMMEMKEVPGYAFQDFWSGKPKYTHWFYRAAAFLIAPLSVCIFNNAQTIPVYHDNRLMTTFKKSIAALEAGERVIIYPESYTPYNHIVYEFQDKFVDTARLYYKRTGKRVHFVPMYIAPALHAMYLGEPTLFDPDAPIEEERRRICRYLMDGITALAEDLPEHRVVPYPNIPKKDYPSNKRTKV